MTQNSSLFLHGQPPARQVCPAYATVYAFLVEQGHAKAAAAVKKAARPVVDLDHALTAGGPRSLLAMLERHVPDANDVDSSDDSSESSSSDDDSSDEEPVVASPTKPSAPPVVNGKTSKAAANLKRKAPESSSSSSSGSSSDPESSSSESSSSSDSSDDSDSDSDEEKPKLVSKAVSKAKAKESSSSSSSSESSSDSDSSSSSSESEAPPPKKRKLAASSTTTTTTEKVEVTVDSVTVTKTTTTEPAQNGTNLPAKNGKTKGPRKPIVPFSRIKADDVVYADPRLMDNRFESKGGATGDYGERASRDLIVTRGAGFRKEKNKKKRGSYRGGEITVSADREEQWWSLVGQAPPDPSYSPPLASPPIDIN
ncbi:SRP40, carboxy-terminal domain protein [Ceratobasidium sp. AG-Ba]|nr:SRP40, carboxy-terminal domain protein [Ceratobasidium sp. AG-Ba]